MNFEDYQRIGPQVKELNVLLCGYISATSDKVRKSHPGMKHGDKAMKALDVLRGELEEIMFLEFRRQNPNVHLLRQSQQLP
jgi:hypothetical protein